MIPRRERTGKCKLRTNKESCFLDHTMQSIAVRVGLPNGTEVCCITVWAVMHCLYRFWDIMLPILSND